MPDRRVKFRFDIFNMSFAHFILYELIYHTSREKKLFLAREKIYKNTKTIES